MNIRIVYKFIGRVMAVEAAAMGIPLALSLWDKSGDWYCFLITAALLCAIGLPSLFVKETSNAYHIREGFATVGISWFVLSFFGGLPYLISGRFGGLDNCFFESVSGFTTTGSTILYDMSSISRAMHLWRSMTLWMGGLGVLAFTLILAPNTKGSAGYVMKAETPGPILSKLAPKLSDSSKILYFIYTSITLALIILSCALGMDLFDAVCHSFSTTATGGFTTLNEGLEYFKSPSIEWLYAFSMFVSAANFTLIFQLIRKNFKAVIGDDEFKLFIGIVLISTALIAFELAIFNVYGIVESVRKAFFHVTSVISTTGHATADTNVWPEFSKTILTMLMFCGGSSGSTAGGLKVIRIFMLLKIIHYEISKAIHPREVKSLKISGKPVNEQIISALQGYFIIYVFVFMLALFIISTDNLTFETSFSAVATSINNVGIAFGNISHFGDINVYSPLSKFVLSLCMLIGRLEIFPVILLFSPSFWKRASF